MKSIRRIDREITTEEAKTILAKGEYGVLSTVDQEGQPYGVPVNYAYKNGSIYFHCAIAGHKLDNIEKNPKVSFCVVGNTKVLPDKFATEYESVVAFGVATEVKEGDRGEALLLLLEKYSPGFVDEGKEYIDKKFKATKCYKIEIQHLSGKARR